MALNDYIQKARRGDQQAYKFLLEKYWDDVFRFQKNLINNESEAEDITIETFARAFDRLELYNPRYSFKNWLLTISKNLYLDRKAANRRRQQTSSIDEHPHLLNIPDDWEPEDEDILQTKLAELKKALSELKPAYREVLEMYYFNDLPYKEIALRTGLSMSNVKIRILRAKALLAEKLRK